MNSEKQRLLRYCYKIVCKGKKKYSITQDIHKKNYYLLTFQLILNYLFNIFQIISQRILTIPLICNYSGHYCKTTFGELTFQKKVLKLDALYYWSLRLSSTVYFVCITDL